MAAADISVFSMPISEAASAGQPRIDAANAAA